MEIFNNPVLLSIAIVLTIISSVLTWIGLRHKNMPYLVVGIGLGVPTFDMLDYRMWVVGLLVCGLGVWIHYRTS